MIPYSYSVYFEQIDRDRYKYYASRFIRPYEYLVTTKQKGEIIDVWENMTMKIMPWLYAPGGLLLFGRKFWLFSMTIIFIIGLFLFVKVKIDLIKILRDCEKIKCDRKGFFYFEKRSTATRMPKDIIKKPVMGVLFLMMACFFWFLGDGIPHVILWITLSFLVAIAFLEFLTCYKMIRFKMEYKGRLKRKESVRKYRI